jgi:hypothetical protein
MRSDCFPWPIGIELAKGGTVPEQPDDPIHYEMKIPPEPKNDKAEKEDQGSPKNGGFKDTDIARDEHKEERRPGKG